MSDLTKRLLGLVSRAEEAAPQLTAKVEGSGVIAELTRAEGLGLADAVASGWYLNDTNELFRGVPIGPDDTVVDVGCGDGGSTLFCARRGAHVTAVDIDPQVLAAIAPKLEQVIPGRYATHLSNACPLPLEDEVATRVVCTEVLEHVDDPDQVLSELYRIGKPGARYLLTVPDELQENLQKLVAPPSYFERPNHIRIIGREEFEQMVVRAGLVVEEHTQCGFFWAIWWGLFWACKVDLDNPSHPALDHWVEAWKAILALPDGQQYREKLDRFMPKSRVIVARKPEIAA
jgi:SAM-dependent methyltransferase